MSAAEHSLLQLCAYIRTNFRNFSSKRLVGAMDCQRVGLQTAIVHEYRNKLLGLSRKLLAVEIDD